MKTKSSLLIITILGLSISSCSYFESFNEKRKEVENNSKPTIQIKAKAEGKEKEQEEVDPLAKAVEDVEGAKREQETVGLLKSTNPEIRVRASVRGRQDPFSTIIVKPEIEVLPQETKTQKRATLPNRNQRRNQNNNNQRFQPDKNITSTPTIENLEPPQKFSPTETAENVLITGLVEMGDRAKIILQAPGEATSRYVNIGQYISNGRVLVKRIEYGFPAPTVILEQSGIEIAKVIGQPVEKTDENEQALLPPPPLNTSSWLSNYLAP